MNLFKKKLYRSERFKIFIREQPCHICSKPSDPHHLSTGGTGIKGTDLSCFPLCRRCHTEYHTEGKKTFADKHNIDFKHELIKYLMKYICFLEGNNHKEYDWINRGLL